ncbi:KGK domain protein [Nostoc sp. CENA543]|uniref:KGK domain-containing protein n=1 Tax=Nostoc sp. CENA543 TaxID=1869241 RepID=UPI000CA1D7C0|nr:KGK domain-containing protein [Nostoc sp. CENA543]AUT02977.1 KGK domain protein [Nostoc sp. CENA543]
MEDNFNLSNCSDNDVFSVKDQVFKASQIRQALQKIFLEQLSKELYILLNDCGISIDPGGYIVGNRFYRYDSQFFEEGIECEILQPGTAGWQTGKVRINVNIEFIPDTSNTTASTSPLDDLRRRMNEE